VDLYEIAHTLDLPPLSPAQQARWDSARTCAECGLTSVDPLFLGPDKRTRWCSSHQDLPWRRLWEERVARGRAEAAAWAAEVLSDPTAVLCASFAGSRGALVRVEGLSGRVLVDVRVRPEPPGGLRPEWIEGLPGEVVDTATAIDRLTPISGCRGIHWGGSDLAWVWGVLGTVMPKSVPADRFGARWADWLAVRETTPYLDPAAAPYRQRHQVRRQYPRQCRDDVAGVIGQIRDGLRVMAEGSEPDAP
jgi:hypothetical protein